VLNKKFVYVYFRSPDVLWMFCWHIGGINLEFYTVFKVKLNFLKIADFLNFSVEKNGYGSVTKTKLAQLPVFKGIFRHVLRLLQGWFFRTMHSGKISAMEVDF
jgi:hypothetical protein